VHITVQVVEVVVIPEYSQAMEVLVVEEVVMEQVAKVGATQLRMDLVVEDQLVEVVRIRVEMGTKV